MMQIRKVAKVLHINAKDISNLYNFEEISNKSSAIL